MFMDNILLSLARKVNRVNRIYNVDVIVLLQQVNFLSTRIVWFERAD